MAFTIGKYRFPGTGYYVLCNGHTCYSGTLAECEKFVERNKHLTGGGMMTHHTPGPWAFCNETLCQATGNYLHLGKFIESSGLGKQAEANKRLIAAAPELLELLQHAVETIKGEYPKSQWDECRVPAMEAAIRKATVVQK